MGFWATFSQAMTTAASAINMGLEAAQDGIETISEGIDAGANMVHERCVELNTTDHAFITARTAKTQMAIAKELEADPDLLALYTKLDAEWPERKRKRR